MASTNFITVQQASRYENVSVPSHFSKTNIGAVLLTTALAVAGVATLVFAQLEVGLPLLGGALIVGALAIKSFYDRHQAIKTIHEIRQKDVELRQFETDLNTLLNALQTSLEEKGRGKDTTLNCNFNQSSPVYELAEAIKSGDNKRDDNIRTAVDKLKCKLDPLFRIDDNYSSEIGSSIRLTSPLGSFLVVYSSAIKDSKADQATSALRWFTPHSFSDMNTVLQNAHDHHSNVMGESLSYLGADLSVSRT